MPPQNRTPGDRVALDPTTVDDQGRTACELADELARVRGAWWRDTDRAGDAFGYRDLDQAYQQTHETWFAELGVYVEVLSELCAKIRASAAQYQRTDTDSAARLGGAR